jgi:sodium-dependent dicarboxylate transporter 2/3/5
MSSDAAATPAIGLGWNKYLFMSIGIIVVRHCLLFPALAGRLDPEGKAFALSPEGKGALAVFCWPPPGGCSRWCPSA